MDARGLEPAERVPASRKLGREEAREILAASDRVIVARRGRVATYESPGRDDRDVVDRMLGTTGNLRAPLVRSGGTTLVGFDEDAWANALG